VSGNEVTVLIVADPGLPTHKAEAIVDDLREELKGPLRERVQVDFVTQVIRLKPDYALDFEGAEQLEKQYDAAITMLVTEIPRYESGHPLVAEVFRDQLVGVVSCPSMGVLATKNRLMRTIAACIELMVQGEQYTSATATPSWSKWSYRPETNSYALHAHTLTGGPRMVLGMVVENQPWRTMPRLTGVMAAAIGTGAFGIFYNSIWVMADRLSIERLVVIGVLALATMVAWLMVTNRLWDRPVRHSLATVVLYYNASTVVTLLLCVIGLYAVLFCFILLGAFIVIDDGFMSDILGHEAGFNNYLRIAAMAASMGLIAGALGAGFDSDADLRRLTHGQRERLRLEDAGAEPAPNSEDS